MHSIQPKFGAILIKQDQLNKLKDSSLGTPDFHADFTVKRHQSNNAQVRGALRSRTGISDLHIGGCWGSENGGEPPNKKGYQDSVILTTRADALAEMHPATGDYDKHHQDEEALTKALDQLDIRYERGPFKTLYQKAYQNSYD